MKPESHTRFARLLCRAPSIQALVQLVSFVFVLTMWLGCASGNVNPATARPQTGYVDIYVAEGGAFTWEIRDVRGQRSLYTEYTPKSEIVRLALSPGSYELTISILNTLISKPATTEVQVAEGQVTPVRVRLVEEGTAQIENKHTQVPGRYTRRTKITVDQSQSFRLDADVLPAISYAPKERVPYALKPGP